MNRNQYLIFLSQIKWGDLKVENLRRNIKVWFGTPTQTHVFNFFFIHTYFYTYFQTTKYMFLNAYTKHLLNFIEL